MNPKKANCTKCGVLKTSDNTSLIWTEDESEKFYNICKSCSSKEVRDRRYAGMSDECILRIYNKHLNCIEMIKVVLKERKL
jgi:hypothetical protein